MGVNTVLCGEGRVRPLSTERRAGRLEAWVTGSQVTSRPEQSVPPLLTSPYPHRVQRGCGKEAGAKRDGESLHLGNNSCFSVRESLLIILC